VHRDLKPENLFLAHVEGAPPVVKVVDFGIAKMLEETVAPTSMGQMLGTPKYMAPEQVARDTPITPACDRFALGLIAYRLLAGEGYHRGNSLRALTELLQGSLESPSRRHPSFGAAFDTWFARACHRDPRQRFGTAREQVAALASVLAAPA
jgi:eukaryotic-like serine/threonine-protein kinase